MRLEIPFDVGDKVYPLSCLHSEYEVVEISYYKNQNTEYVEFEIKSVGDNSSIAYYDTFELGDIGNTIFFDKEERNKVLRSCLEAEARGAIHG